MKKIEAIIRPLTPGRSQGSAQGDRSGRHHDQPGHGLRPSKGLYRNLSRHSDRYQHPAQNQNGNCCPDNSEALIDAIIGAARMGEIGDGKIFVTDIRDAIRIRTGERGDIAL